MRIVKGEGKRDSHKNTAGEPHEPERRSPPDPLIQQDVDKRDQEQEIHPPRPCEPQKESHNRSPPWRGAKQQPAECQDGDAIGREVATGDDLLQKDGREQQKAPQQEQRPPGIVQDLSRDEEEDGQPEEVLIGAVSQHDEGEGEQETSGERSDRIPQVGGDVVRASSSKELSDAEIQGVVAITPATDDPRIGDGINDGEEDKEHEPCRQCESVSPTPRYQSFRLAQEPMRDAPKSENQEGVEKRPPHPGVFLHLPQGGNDESEGHAEGRAPLMTPQACPLSREHPWQSRAPPHAHRPRGESLTLQRTDSEPFGSDRSSPIRARRSSNLQLHRH